MFNFVFCGFVYRVFICSPLQFLLGVVVLFVLCLFSPFSVGVCIGGCICFFPSFLFGGEGVFCSCLCCAAFVSNLVCLCIGGGSCFFLCVCIFIFYDFVRVAFVLCCVLFVNVVLCVCVCCLFQCL